MRVLQQNEAKFVCSTACQTAFDDIKGIITEYLQLALFDPQCETHVSVDASDVGLGASLTQMQNGAEVTVSCTSHTLFLLSGITQLQKRKCLPVCGQLNDSRSICSGNISHYIPTSTLSDS